MFMPGHLAGPGESVPFLFYSGKRILITGWQGWVALKYLTIKPYLIGYQVAQLP